MQSKSILNHPDLFDDELWYLAFRKQFDLLKSRTTEEGVHIDLNAAPQGKGILEEGMTSAWILGFSDQFDLLEELADQEGIEPVNLNLGPMAEDTPYKGVSLGLLLAQKGQSELLEKLANKPHAEPINLNVFPESSNHHEQGMTLGLCLSAYSKWELLDRLADKAGVEPVNLNLSMQQEKHPDRGINLGWHLLANQQLALFEKLANKESAELIQLDAKPFGENHSQFEKTVQDILLFYLKEGDNEWIQNYPKLPEKLLATCEIEFLQALINHLPDNEFLWQVKLTTVERIFTSISTLLSSYSTMDNAIKEEMNENIAVLLSLLSQVCASSPADSDYYKKAQNTLAHLLMNIESCGDVEFYKYVVKHLEEKLLLTMPTSSWMQSISPKSILKQAIMMSLSKAQNFELLANFFAEMENSKLKLEMENRELKSKIEGNKNVKRKFSAIENLSEGEPPPKRKKEVESSEEGSESYSGDRESVSDSKSDSHSFGSVFSPLLNGPTDVGSVEQKSDESTKDAIRSGSTIKGP